MSTQNNESNIISLGKKLPIGITIRKDINMNNIASKLMPDNIVANGNVKNNISRPSQPPNRITHNNPKPPKVTKASKAAELKKKNDESNDLLIKDLKCPYCPYQLSTRAKSVKHKPNMAKYEFEDHINAAHERKYCLKCPKCYFSGFWRNTFYEHLTLLHHIFPPSANDEQDENILEGFKNTEVRLIASLARVKLNCNICRTDFNNENDLILHKESNHEVKSNLYFLCPECDF